MTLISVRPLSSSPADGSRQKATARAVMSPLTWMAVTCLILGISGGLRYWRESQFAALAVDSANCPFPLAELPRTTGTWQADQDSETFLDPEVARVAGASEHIIRGYREETSGERATALILYGLAAVSFHTPDICYPAAGYRVVQGPIDRTITVPGVKQPVRYRWAIYTKREGGVNRYEEAYFTFLHNGDWMPDAADHWKMFRYHPGLFKVQISHAVSSMSESGEGPCESLLKGIVREINDRVSPGRSGS